MMLCVAGAAISGGLVREHAGPWPGTEGAAGVFSYLCGDAEPGGSNCAAALQSDWSAFDVTIPTVTSALKITPRRIVVPLAFVGLAYFLSLGIWFAFAGSPRTWGRWYFVPLAAVMMGACGSALLLWILIAKLESTCTWCIITHATNGLLLIGVLFMRPRRRVAGNEVASEGFELTPLSYREVLRLAGFAVFVIMGLWMYRGAKLETRAQVAKLLPYKKFVDQRKDDPAFLVREFYAGPQQPILAVTPGGQGEESSPVPVVTIFTDFQCPHCACLAQKWKRVYSKSWQGPLRVSLRHLPLSKACNAAVTSDLHPQACDAGYAAEAARLQGGDEAFWNMHDQLFSLQGRLGKVPYAELAARVGLDGARLLSDMDSSAVKESVAADVELASKLGVRSTPSVFLNGRRVPKFCLHNPIFWQAVSEDLNRDRRVAANAARSVDVMARGSGINP